MKLGHKEEGEIYTKTPPVVREVKVYDIDIPRDSIPEFLDEINATAPEDLRKMPELRYPIESLREVLELERPPERPYKKRGEIAHMLVVVPIGIKEHEE